MRRILLAVAMVGLVAPSMAQNMDSLVLAQQLGGVLAAEDYCELQFDQEAVSAFIEDHVAPDDMAFSGYLDTFIGGSERDQEKMGTSQKTAHCAQVIRVARSNGFVH